MEYLMNGLEFIVLMILWALLTIANFAFLEVFPIVLKKCVKLFLGPCLHPMEVPRLWVEWELQLPSCAIATAMPDLSCI